MGFAEALDGSVTYKRFSQYEEAVPMAVHYRDNRMSDMSVNMD